MLVWSWMKTKECTRSLMIVMIIMSVFLERLSM